MVSDPPRSIWLRLGAVLRRRKLDRDLDEELSFHIAMREQKLRESGLSADEARQAARRRFGNVTLAKEETRDLWLFRWLESLWFDLRYAARSLRKSPVLALVVVISLALGIGANTAIFGIVDAVILKLLPVRNPRELVLLAWGVPGKMPHQYVEDIEGDGWSHEGANFGSTTFAPATLEQLRQRQVFAAVAAYSRNEDQANLAFGGRAESVEVQAVSGDFFHALGVVPMGGRAILPSDDRPDAPAVAMASYKFWQEKLGGDSSAIGRTVTINGEPATLIGVLPPDFFGVIPGRVPQIWSTLSQHVAEYRRINKFDLLQPKIFWLGIVARLKPSVTPAQATAQAELVFRQSIIPPGQPVDSDAPRLTLRPAERGFQGLREEFSTSLLLLMGMVGLVLLIACANVAGLLLARATSRRREIATRLSLGASRLRIVRQLLTESLTLAILGGAAGLLVARWATAALAALLSNHQDVIVVPKHPDWRMVGFAAAVSLLGGIGFGLAPAFSATRVSLFPALKHVPGVTATQQRRFLSGKVLVGAQVGLALLLLISAGLLLRSLRRLETTNLGFNREGLIFFKIEPGNNGYKDQSLISYYEELQRRLQQVPGVEGVGISQIPEIGDGWSQGRAYFEGFTPPRTTVRMFRHWVGPGYFQAMGIPVLLGRPIEERDRRAGAATPPDVAGAEGATPFVVVLNRRAVERYMRGDTPLGHNMHTGALGNTMKMQNGIQGFGGEYTIVGVVGDAKFGDIREDAPPTAYFSYLQRDPPPAVTFHVRYRGPRGAALAGIELQVASLDSNIPIREIATMGEAVDDALAVERTFAFLSSAFGGLALLLACIGLYGTISYTVAQRTSEIGIRMALGAQRRRIVGMVVRETLLVVAAGIVVGLPLAWAATKLLQAQLFGLSTHDPVSIALALAVISAVTLLAGLLPARRAAAIDPMIALRCE
jgi:predicted permease